ncbi:MAG: CocE/NonD family hydrolase [Desulfatitalea sp.]|nr:CocE/NonD family hydrolase [Desulfatitalea sp.]
MRSWLADVSMPIRHGIYRTRNIMVPMRDGTKLATDIHRPLSGNGPYPVLLVRMTYGSYDQTYIDFFVKNGYVLVAQDVRGRYDSEGDTYSPHRYSRNDGYDTIDWIVKQKWASGKVGTIGCSYLGEVQILLAAAKHPNHVALVAEGAGGAMGSAMGTYDYFGLFENGVFNLASGLGWFTGAGATYDKVTPRPSDLARRLAAEIKGLPVAQLAQRVVPYKTGYDDFILRPLTDPSWMEEGYISDQDTFGTAALHVNTWYDQTVGDAFRLAQLMAENSINKRGKAQHVLIDPGIHCHIGEMTTGTVRIGEMESRYLALDYGKIYLDWFEYWLKGKPKKMPPRFKYFVIHADHWETSDRWPPEKVHVRKFHLRSSGRLDPAMPYESAEHSEGETVFDSFVYDPRDPVPSLGGTICCMPRAIDIQGAVDQSPLKKRKDVLIYTTDALRSDFDLIGNAKATLYVATSTPDTDFTFKLVDEYPDGTAYNLQDGVVRLRYREGMAHPKLAEPNVIYRVEIELRPIAYRFKKRHRISAYFSSSNFPRLARNLNTGGPEYTGTEIAISENSIYRSNQHASFIELPVVSTD